MIIYDMMAIMHILSRYEYIYIDMYLKYSWYVFVYVKRRVSDVCKSILERHSPMSRAFTAFTRPTCWRIWG